MILSLLYDSLSILNLGCDFVHQKVLVMFLLMHALKEI